VIGIHDLVVRLRLKRAGRDWRGTCPACGYGRGAFVVSIGRTGRPVAWCASCQDGDAIAHALGVYSLPLSGFVIFAPVSASLSPICRAFGASRPSSVARWRRSRTADRREARGMPHEPASRR
jgi:hypothetical protein